MNNVDIANIFKENTLKEFGNQVVSIMLYGSVAKGKDKKDSDIDVLVVIKRNPARAREKISYIMVNILERYGVLVAPVVLSNNEFSNIVRLKSPFIQEVMNHGKTLYNAG